MASEKQLEANLANAQKSTGPRMNAGKARSRLNSRKHGLTAKTLIIVGENADDFDQLRADLMDEYDPQSSLECELVERLAGILCEAAILDARQARVAEDMNEKEERRAQRWHGYEEEDGEDREKEEDEEEADWEASVRFGRALSTTQPGATRSVSSLGTRQSW